MQNVEELRNNVINKILTISNINFLEALDNIIVNNSEIIHLSPEQHHVLELSEQDIINNRAISQENLINRNLEWLNAI